VPTTTVRTGKKTKGGQLATDISFETSARSTGT
jgi:hypothetical protein